MTRHNLKILLFSIFSLWIASLFFSCSSLQLVINGSGKIKAQEIRIDDYDRIVIDNAFQYEYIDGAESSFLTIETDENLLPYFHCYVKNRTLHIEIKNPETGEIIPKYLLKSSKCLIRTGSPQLLQVTQTGSSEFSVLNNFTGHSFELSQTGSGFFCFTKDVQLGDLKMTQTGSGTIIVRGVCRTGNITGSRTGSGDIEFYNLIQGKKIDISSTGSGHFLSDWDINVDFLNFNHTGSGNSIFNGIISAEQFNFQQSGSGYVTFNGFLDIGLFNINRTGSGSLSLKKGDVKNGHFHSSGSGGITGRGCTFHELECELIGSTYVTATVSELLSAAVSGSGRLTVYGSPKLKYQTISGSGTLILRKE